MMLMADADADAADVDAAEVPPTLAYTPVQAG